MTATDVLALLPLVLVAATSVVVMVAAAVRRNHALALGITFAGLASAFCLVLFVHPRQVTALLSMDRYALFFMG
jgi:NADH-quinone oxidoreductase subunit N